MVLSRLARYAVLTALAMVLLITAYSASGSYGRTAMQFHHGSVEPRGFHLTQALDSARTSVGVLRRRMHNTWLFLYAFLAVWMIVLAWGVVERNRLRLEVGRAEVYWMGWMSLSVFSTAILYGMGTNGILARRYPRAVGISDVLAIGFVLALPAFAWSRLHRQREEEPGGEDPAVLHHRKITTLQLNLGDSFIPAAKPSRGSTSLREPELVAATQAFAVTPSAMAIVTAGGDVEPQLVAEPVLPDLSQECLPEPVKEAAPEALQSVPVSSAPLRHAQPAALAFREHLRALNESWARIEESRQEIERWFDQQREQVISRLEKHPGVREPEEATELSNDFLNEKLAAVDAEWAKIRKNALEIARWFGDVPSTNKEPQSLPMIGASEAV